MTAAFAVIPTDLEHTGLGLQAQLGDTLAGASVLEQTLRRVARVASVRGIVLVHPAGQSPLSLIDAARIGKPVTTFADDALPHGRHTARWVAGRKWALTAWRGGLGGATVYDELLPPGPLVRAMRAHDAESALLLGADWPLVDPDLCERVLRRHLDQPEAMKLTFTQAPPGLCGIAVARSLLEQFDTHAAGFGSVLGYNPRAPGADAVGTETNLPIPPTVRDCRRRFIYDTPRTIAMIRTIFDDRSDARAAAQAASAFVDLSLPQQVTLELTPRRAVTGPITPQHHVALERADLDPGLAERLFDQLGGSDTSLLLGGLGDALLHPQWDRIVLAAHQAGVFGIGVETDLLCGPEQIDRLLELPLDLITVRLNADTAATYQQVMGTDGFRQVIGNLERLINSRARRAADSETSPVGMPWIVPRLIKTWDTLPEMETFFDKWLVYLGSAVIEPARDGCGLMPPQSPVDMQPPRRHPCRQLGNRMTIHSDGTVARCDQDWLGHGAAGDANVDSLLDIWRRLDPVIEAHRQGRYAELTLCGQCTQWHRP